MVALFDDPAFVQHEDLVEAFHAVQAMGDGEDGPALAAPVEGVEHGLFGDGIEVGRGFVEDDHRGILEDHAGDGEALTFAAAEVHAVLTGPLVEADVQAVETRCSEGLPELRVSGTGVGEQEVFADALPEEVGLLGDHRDVPAEDFRVQQVDLFAADRSV